MQLWRPEFELDGINSGSWYHCLMLNNKLPLMAQLMPLPLSVSWSSKSRLVLPSWFYFVVLAHPGSPRHILNRHYKN